MPYLVPFYSRFYSWVDRLVAWSLRTELMVVMGLVGLVSHYLRRYRGANTPNIADLHLKMCLLDANLLPLQ